MTFDIGCMKRSMETGTCSLDAIRASDLSQVARLFSDPAVRSFLGGPLSAPVAEQRASELLTQAVPAMVWAVRQTSEESNSLLGVVLLDRHHDLEDFEVSYLFLPEHWGRGYATAAVQQVLAYAFGVAGHQSVVAETQTANISSVRLLERLGFRQLRQVTRFGAEQSIYVAESCKPGDL
ncbi:GNAT family N-acetyltransferase [Methylobacter sp.]|uniref:GNAT family N-acetyltransferase n=2 Tax=Methylobacter sp. TaxID=2051955 RepID=UPI002FE08EA7